MSSNYKKSKKIICFNLNSPTLDYKNGNNKVTHEYEKSMTVKDVDNIFKEKRGYVPIPKIDSMKLYKEFGHKIYKTKKCEDIIGTKSNLFGETYDVEMIYCKWCAFLGYEPPHPASWITNDPDNTTGGKAFPECENLIVYRNYLRSTEQHNNKFSSRFKEVLLKEWQIDTGQRVYKVSEIKKILIERDGEKCFKSGITTDLTAEHNKPLDKYWPLIPENACLLYKPINSSKRHKWPSEFYNESELKRLSEITGTPIKELLTPSLNHVFLDWVEKNWNRIEEIIDNRKELKQVGGKDNFKKDLLEDIELSKRARNTIDNI